MEAIITQIQQTPLVEWIGAAAGLIGVYLSIKEKVLAWPFFILCYAMYVFLSIEASLFAAMTLNACFIPIAIYGWWQWSKLGGSGGDGRDLAISRLSPRLFLVLACIQVVGTLVIGFVLHRYTQGVWPYFDAFATTLSFLAQWMLSRKYLENWIAWLFADMVYIGLWGMQGYWVAVGMFSVFTLLAVFGFVSWRKELAKPVE